MNSHRETSALIDLVAKAVDVGECTCHNCDERRVHMATRIVAELQSRFSITPLAPPVAQRDESQDEWRIT